MNPNRTKAQKMDSVMTFVVVLIVLGALALGAFYTLTTVIPAFNDFLAQLQGIKTTN